MNRLSDITLYPDFSPEVDKGIFSEVNPGAISALYILFLGGYKPKGTSRISIFLKDKDGDEFHLGSVLAVSANFDLNGFLALDKLAKKRYILDTVHRICFYCADKFGWETAPFEIAYQKVLDADFIYSIETKKKTSKDKKYKAAIGLDKLNKYALITARFYDKEDNFMKQVELLKAFDDEMFYGRIIKNFQWFSNSEFGVANFHGSVI